MKLTLPYTSKLPYGMKWAHVVSTLKLSFIGLPKYASIFEISLVDSETYFLKKPHQMDK